MQYHYEFDGGYGQILGQYQVRFPAAIRMVFLRADTGEKEKILHPLPDQITYAQLLLKVEQHPQRIS